MLWGSELAAFLEGSSLQIHVYVWRTRLSKTWKSGPVSEDTDFLMDHLPRAQIEAGPGPRCVHAPDSHAPVLCSDIMCLPRKSEHEAYVNTP